MSTPKIWDSVAEEWVPITDGQSSVPAAPQGTISAGQAMVYDSPGVWRPESVARQQDLDDLRDEFDGHHHDERYFGCVGLVHSGTASTATAASAGWQVLPASFFDTVVAERRQAGATASAWTVASNLFTAPATGWYRFEFQFSVAAAYAGLKGIAFQINGTGIYSPDHFEDTEQYKSASFTFYLTGGQTLNPLWHNATATSRTIVGGIDRTRFSWNFIRP